MVVGWQSSFVTLSAIVEVFNREYLDMTRDDEHRGMRLIAYKKLAIASLHELKPRIDAWYRELESRSALSFESQRKKKEVQKVIAQVAKFADIRNAAFHYGDAVEPTEQLIRLYEDIDSLDLAFLNRILGDLMNLGEQLRQDALMHCG